MKLPAAIFEQHIAVLGKTRSGKSSVLRYIVEHLLDEKQPVCVIDPKGDWWGLKSSASGKSAGYSVVIFGGEHADVPINAHSGSHVAELIATGNRPCIIDLGGWTVSDRTRFFIDFASTLFRTTRGNRYIVIDEAHNFAPQGKVQDPEAGKMLHWANRLASEGAGKGLLVFSATQRPQKIHKDFLTCAETLIAMRVIHPLDRKAVKDWIDGCPDADKGAEVLTSLASMPRGEGWVWSPEAGYGPKRVPFPMFKTYDSFASQANSGAGKLKGWASVDLDEVSAKLAAVVEEAKANDPKELKKQIADLKRELSKKPAAAADDAAIQRAVSSAVAERDRHWKGELDKIDRARKTAVGKLSKIHELSHVNGEATVEVVGPPIVSVTPKLSAPKPTPRVPRAPAADGDCRISKTQQRILDALAWYESMGDSSPTLTKIGAVALIDPTGGHFSNTVGPLSTSGLVVRGDGRMSLTDAGRELASPIESPGTLADYHETLKARVRKMKSASGRTVEMIDVIAARNGESITCEEIGAEMGIDHTGGHFSNTIGPLSTAGLITRSGGVVTPTDVLFPEGLN